MPQKNEVIDPLSVFSLEELAAEEEEEEKKEEPKHRRVQLLMRESEVKLAHRICKRQRVSFNELMNRLLRQYLQEFK